MEFNTFSLHSCVEKLNKLKRTALYHGLIKKTSRKTIILDSSSSDIFRANCLLLHHPCFTSLFLYLSQTKPL